MGTGISESEMSQAFISSSPLLPACKWHRRKAVCMLASEGGGEGDTKSAEEKNGAGNTRANKPTPKKPEKTIRSNASWGNEFYPQFGRKGPGSRPHWDLRPKSLRSDDEGAGVCDDCKGTGIMDCSLCNGAPSYDENGSVLICGACKNKFQVTCSTCFGSKKQVELVRFRSLYCRPDSFFLFLIGFTHFFWLFHVFVIIVRLTVSFWLINLPFKSATDFRSASGGRKVLPDFSGDSFCVVFSSLQVP